MTDTQPQPQPDPQPDQSDQGTRSDEDVTGTPREEWADEAVDPRRAEEDEASEDEANKPDESGA